MEQKVCLDTDVVISILNNEERAINIINRLEDSKIFISAITFFELMLRKTHLDAIETFRNKVQIIDFDEGSARKASNISKELKKNGKIIDFRDIFIASSCVVSNCVLATFNRKHFESIKELIIL